MRTTLTERTVIAESRITRTRTRLTAWRQVDLRQSWTRAYKRTVRRMRRKYRRLLMRRQASLRYYRAAA